MYKKMIAMLALCCFVASTTAGATPFKDDGAKKTATPFTKKSGNTPAPPPGLPPLPSGGSAVAPAVPQAEVMRWKIEGMVNDMVIILDADNPAEIVMVKDGSTLEDGSVVKFPKVLTATKAASMAKELKSAKKPIKAATKKKTVKPQKKQPAPSPVKEEERVAETSAPATVAPEITVGLSEKVIEEKQRVIDTALKDASVAQVEKERLAKEKGDLLARLNRLEQDYSSLSAEKAEILDRLEIYRMGSEKEKEGILAELNRNKDALRGAQGQLKTIQEEVAVKTRAISETRESLKQNQQKLADAEKTISIIQETHRRVVSELMAEIKKKDVAIAALQAELSECRKQLLALTNELADTKALLKQTIRNNNEIITGLITTIAPRYKTSFGHISIFPVGPRALVTCDHETGQRLVKAFGGAVMGKYLGKNHTLLFVDTNTVEWRRI